MSNDTVTSHVLNVPQTEPAVTASRVLKRPGRKGDKIKTAFLEIPENPVSFVDYAAKHGVSTNVLRQIKRHDIHSDLGKVFVRKNKQTKTMMIWRVPPETKS